MTERPYFSIGEVLGLLLEEFSDVTISKIRFLESQGLIDPERTSSGYRKFYDADVERLRYILHEQKDNYLPLKVIKERLDGIDHTLPNPPRPLPAGASWAIDPGTVPAAAALDPAPTHRADPSGEAGSAVAAARVGHDEPVEVEVLGFSATASFVAAIIEAPANGHAGPDRPDPVPPDLLPTVIDVETAPPPGSASPAPAPAPPARPPGPAVLSLVRDPGRSTVQLSATELCERARIPASVLRQLEEYGLLAGRVLGTETTYDAEALRVAELARRLLELGLEVRHLRTWRMNAEKEVSLFEQLVLPLLRQRNPQARQHATDTLHELAELGAELRGLLVETALRTYLDR